MIASVRVAAGEAAQSDGRLVVEGPAGIGKTRLLRAPRDFPR
jgi:MoxR-like ATPase